jgi:tetratricopeptide (TPR) repeat protein
MTTDRKQRMLVYGNCQGGWLAKALGRDAEIAARYDIVYLSDYHVTPPDHQAVQPGFMAGCDVAVWQTAAGCKPPEFVAALPASCRQVRFPTLWLKLLWPTYAVDPRNQPEAGFPWGRYAYGDRLVMKLLQEGVSPEEMPKRYAETDLNTIVNLDRFTEMSLAELRFNDRQSDVAIAPFIERTFRARKLFGTVNHPTMRMLQQIYLGVTAALLGSTVAPDAPPPADAADVLGDTETPLHPQIISHFKLSWAVPGMRWRYFSAFLTMEEYIRAYAAFTPIPVGEPPDLFLARAHQAVGLNDFAEAQRLLLEGTTRFPAVVQFLQYLGMLFLRQGKLIDAEKVVRYAISQHPRVAALYSNLGVVLLKRGFAGEAARQFQEALRLDPSHKEARTQLVALTVPRTMVAALN